MQQSIINWRAVSRQQTVASFATGEMFHWNRGIQLVCNPWQPVLPFTTQWCHQNDTWFYKPICSWWKFCQVVEMSKSSIFEFLCFDFNGQGIISFGFLSATVKVVGSCSQAMLTRKALWEAIKWLYGIIWHKECEVPGANKLVKKYEC